MTREELLESVKKEAEGYFERGEFFCSEAVVHTINRLLDKPYNDDIVKMASGFPIGMGKSGCLCGAVSGGQMALGMVYGRVHGEPMNDKMFPIAAELHDFIKEEYNSTCCRVMTRQWAGDNFKSPERKKHCVEITGKVAEWVAEKLIEDGQVKIK
ncbi:C-GCAxxG-C-C family protein [Anaerosalibacter bizertensis]|uniref:C-GCAxxG-C-C family protein n=1 Tax=Anaerosalibacter bizertensis TaxID=932217 RepID=A0A9Q4ABV7_9FIRM|nr:C-GCAxxG-C-C family protein [Anaerosalibacter bizertensis]MBV1817509.1 C-GCAxxG-C-C family protein [Bacteroidales bacterium MSK.15.36]MCG4564811.1 C-GCAxxG-C-C family protein [Anaerosalibacter bizertensis]MCG4583530.1 C-GCAxxG-C-C family protein [Anaerosalibacter bizertensis]HHV27617.1 C_GCAxxG_C_C family protein [Tissierellia bacterium]